MATATLTKWGNSVGIRIPKAILTASHLHLGSTLEIKVDNNGVLTLIPINNAQAGWLAQFNAIADSSDETAPIEIVNDFDRDEWTW